MTQGRLYGGGIIAAKGNRLKAGLRALRKEIQNTIQTTSIRIEKRKKFSEKRLFITFDYKTVSRDEGIQVTVPKLVNFFRPLQKWETTTLPLRLFHVSLRQIAPFSP
jgi:hypothetical protein